MIKLMICLLWGHKPFVVIETVVHAPVADNGRSKVQGARVVAEWMKLMRGSTVISLQCPRCCELKVIEQ